MPLNDGRFRVSALAFLAIPTLIPAAAAPQGTAPLNETDPAAYYGAHQRATSLYADGRYAEAAPLLAELAARSPGDASLWYRLGRSNEQLERHSAAIEAYRSALEMEYRYAPSTTYRVARLFAAQGQADSAFVWLEHALERGYDDRPGLASDPAFDLLQDDPRFASLVGALPSRPFTRDEGWGYDLDFLLTEVKRLHGVHGGPAQPAVSASFESAVNALRERIPELSNDRIVVELGRVMALLGDGHTGIYGAGKDTPLPFEGQSLPVLFYQFEDGLHIVNAEGDADRWIGARVLAFGPRPTADLLHDLSDYVHQDNPMTPTWLGVHFYLGRTDVLQALGATDDLSRVTLTVQDRQGNEHRVTLEGGRYEFPRKLRPPPNSTERPPLYLGDVDRNYWLHPLPDANAVYWQFNQVRDMDGGPSVAAFADSLRAMLGQTEAENLIIDVRHNNGGNNGLLAPLVRTIVWWENDTPDRRIFVITGRNTFSAAQNFINLVERWTDAVFVGEPSSSRPNFSGEETNLVLPFSRVRGSISTNYWQDSDPGDVRRWIAPQVPVALSSTDYFGQRDPSMAAIMKIIAEAR